MAKRGKENAKKTGGNGAVLGFEQKLFRAADKLRNTMNAYHNRAIATAEIIDELMKIAREIREQAIAAGTWG